MISFMRITYEAQTFVTKPKMKSDSYFLDLSFIIAPRVPLGTER